MLEGDFFTINSIHTEEKSVTATLELNPAHPIFDGHFPGQPVVPGVCMMQMVKEILETAINRETMLVQADYLKFLSLINPVENKIIQAELKYDSIGNSKINVVASLFHASTTFLKLKALFIRTYSEP